MFERSKATIALAILTCASSAHAQDEACRIQMRIGGEWTVPQECALRREGTRVRIETRADLGIDGAFEDPSSAPRIVGRIACSDAFCAEPFAQPLDAHLTPVDRGGVRGWTGDAIVNGEDVPFEIQRASTPARVRSAEPPTIARANVPPISDLAGEWQMRWEASGEWQGGYEARIARANGRATFTTEVPFFGAIEARVEESGSDLSIRGERRDEEGRTHLLRARLMRQSDGAYTGRLGPRGPRIEIRRLLARGALPDLAGRHTCRIGGSQSFACAIEVGDADTWMAPDRGPSAPYTLEGGVVRTPSGFRVWGVFQCIEGDGCAVQGVSEFVEDPSGDRWRGFVAYRGRYIEVEMTRGSNSR